MRAGRAQFAVARNTRTAGISRTIDSWKMWAAVPSSGSGCGRWPEEMSAAESVTTSVESAASEKRKTAIRLALLTDSVLPATRQVSRAASAGTSAPCRWI